jgi:hypothetical protein
MSTGAMGGKTKDGDTKYDMDCTCKDQSTCMEVFFFDDNSAGCRAMNGCNDCKMKVSPVITVGD